MTERNHSLDLLRIIAMFMILTVHFFGWGGAVNQLTFSDKNYYFVMPLYFISQIGNTLFFLLSGYFSGGKLRVKSLLSLERKTAFYAVVISAIALLTGINGDISWMYVVKCEFPVLFNRYWFVSVYVILSLLAPVLVRGLERCSPKVILAAIVALLAHNTFLYSANMTLLQGLHMFVIGYYLRRYDPLKKIKKWVVLLMYVGSVALYAGERFFSLRMEIEHTALDEGLRYTLITLMAVLLLEFFTKLDIKAQWPSKISGNVLAVYLITVCPAIYHQLYENWLHIDMLCREWWFGGYYLLINIMLFTGCVLIDKIVSKINTLEVKTWIKVKKKLFY